MAMTYEEALRATLRQNWQGLSTASRLEALQAIEDQAAAEANRIPRKVEGEWLHVDGNGTVMGQYCSRDKKIQVNLEVLDGKHGHDCGADRMVETVLHEGRHSYQKQVVAGEVRHHDAREAKDWAVNLAPGGYVSFEHNPRAYWSQPVEADARAYARERLGKFQQERAGLEQTMAAREAFERQGGNRTQAAAPSEAPPQETSAVVTAEGAIGQRRNGARNGHGMRR